MKEIQVPNIYQDIDLGEGNKISEYSALDLQRELNSETPVIMLQKSTAGVLDGILEKVGVKDRDQCSIKKMLGRAGFLKLYSRQYGQLALLAAKGADSTQEFSQISDYYLGGTDIGQKSQARGVELEKINSILGESLWRYKTELLLLIGINSINRVIQKDGDIENFELDTLVTKFTPTLTRQSIDVLGENIKKPQIIAVDSNSELDVQVQEILYPNKLIGGVEIVQSGASLIATNNMVVRNGKIYMPSQRSTIDGKFEGDIIAELDPASQVGSIANSIQTEVNVDFSRILRGQDEVPQEFIDAIVAVMKEI